MTAWLITATLALYFLGMSLEYQQLYEWMTYREKRLHPTRAVLYLMAWPFVEGIALVLSGIEMVRGEAVEG